MMKFNIEDNIIRLDASRRGGGIEIDVSELFGEGCKMSAYQNYLGGGLLGAIHSDINFMPSEEQKENIFLTLLLILKHFLFVLLMA